MTHTPTTKFQTTLTGSECDSVSAEVKHSLVATCGCGKQSLTMNALPVAELVCHCVDCRAASGNAFTEIAFFRPEACASQGQFNPTVMSGGSGQSKTYFNCPECGDCVYATVSLLRGQVGVVAGLIKGEFEFSPRFHCWTSEKATGVEIAAGVLQFSRGPNKAPHLVQREVDAG